MRRRKRRAPIPVTLSVDILDDIKLCDGIKQCRPRNNICAEVLGALQHDAFCSDIYYDEVTPSVALGVFRAEVARLVGQDEDSYLAELLAGSIAELDQGPKLTRARWTRREGVFLLAPERGRAGVFPVGRRITVTAASGASRQVCAAAVVPGKYAVPFSSSEALRGFDYQVNPWVFLGAGAYLCRRDEADVLAYWRSRTHEVNAASGGEAREHWLDCELHSQIFSVAPE